MPEFGISCIYRAFQYKNLGAFCTANWPARPNATVPLKVTFVATGTCSITAHVATGTVYAAATCTPQTFGVS
jgi:hypothetical protein